MKIKQISSYNGDIIDTILKNRNIKDIDTFLNPNSSEDLNPFDLHNIELGANVLLAHLLINDHIGILVDADADGFSSASIIYQYIKKIEPDSHVSYFLHDRKAHGLTDEISQKIADSSIDLIIIPDAASNDVDELQRLYYMGIDIIVLDHHEVDKMPTHGILINNQLDENKSTNKNLVGAGMAYKFCQALDRILDTHYADDLLDLVAIGQIGDTSDISENEVRNLVFRGLETINNPLVKVAVMDVFGSLEGIAPKDLSFSIIPMINAVVRVGTEDEKDLLFRALNKIGDGRVWNVEKRKKNKKTGKFNKILVEQDLYEYAFDMMKKVKGRQNSMIKKSLEKLRSSTYNEGGISIALLDSSDEAAITGLVANKVAKKYQKPALVLYYKDKKYIGSGRGDEKVLSSLKDWCNETGLVEFAQGHANAFGISIPEDNFEEFKKRTHEVEQNEFVYEVDLIVKENVDRSLIEDVTDNKHLFGGKVQEPLLAFVGIKINKNFIRQKGSMLTFYENGVEFVMYGAPEGLYESLKNNFDRQITMDFVGTPSVNVYGNKRTLQLVLVDCERNESGQYDFIEVPDEINAETIIF
ncbi:DHH family phosphoesterase [Bacillus subtilis]|uniref:DHH family phosphoesterase n=1 Tax=Bacillus subtilis TaxID=1423 RepID=UPI00129E58EA|nr:DHH family phosphoesterase [Bacillus subtilis]MEC2217493.1 DHH family phosphoesterase [Bacillus subtilis]QGI15805.1 hypothetical protein GII80_22350 [Bacillus subtilis]CAF1774647.1 Putative SPBc2 prophage-derived single-strand DNA-specific exonuclease YorK [Bacillus subtilis]CAF1786192.1 Putative SPBc2 prophage-derived single-strand DNA-specific exonuclease YorK [Bacillus subtilis]CAF1852164.1 Putative SPBc2 prophage-derived single-strand DNA-specific exonuclease YorK [Bacillus subtilis]